MKRVQSFKKLKSSQFLADECPTERDRSSKHSRPRSVSAVSTSSFFTALALHDGLARFKFTDPLKSTSGTTSESAERSDGMGVAHDSAQPDACGVEAPILTTSSTTLGSMSGLSSAADGMSDDVPDGAPMPGDAQREHLKQKITKTSERIKIAQTSMNENVEEYLKLANDADKLQAARIKSVFEKRNQKLKASVLQYQKKLDDYHRRYRELKTGGAKTPGGGKYGLKEAGAKLTAGVVGTVKQGFLSSSKMMNKRFGSVDNIVSSLKDDGAEPFDLERCNSTESVSAATSDSGELHFDQNLSNQRSSVARSPPPELTEVKAQVAVLEERLSRLSTLEEQQERLSTEIDHISKQIKRDIGILTATVENSSYRCSRIEDQLHDLSEMHHREMGDVKQDLVSLEEKLIYHAQERARDIQEALESCQTRISKMEVQQLHTRQELVTMEGVENATARALVGKLMNILLSVVAVILVFASTLSKFATPFIRNQTRAAITGICILVFALLYKNWELWSGYFLSAGVESAAPNESAKRLPDLIMAENG